MTSRLYRDEAVVLRTHPLGEADRIVTLLTRGRGQVRAVAKGVRRTSSRFGARLEPFGVVDVQLHRGRTLDVLTQAETIAPYGRTLMADYSLYTCAAVIAETAAQLTADAEHAHVEYALVIGALASLATGRHPAGLVVDSFLLRSLAVAGWAPSFHACARCARPGPHAAFDTPSGGAVCEDCRPPGASAPQPRTLQLLGELLSGDWPGAVTASPAVRAEASALTAAYCQWHLERRLKSLPLVERA
ncbi:DNA repair protein RecO [Buchananella hordeovulneris]|uniref:DNA repair protein RecO n=1 Tax=Buchananella hordeovulneris TaxID=52770 RepID=A0A1Q5PWQ4_9ACTO|nr:DNA repair protein RecO [Buchananella hordeovulneris]OKL52028.1 DNA repair protein RecO [Buchananella hordeovulneris]RRD52576.1 DNA repair protein RecO [Buchananella hordeovulneris]